MHIFSSNAYIKTFAGVHLSSSTIQSNPFSIEEKCFLSGLVGYPRGECFSVIGSRRLFIERERKSGDFIVSCVIAVVIITAKPMEKKETVKARTKKERSIMNVLTIRIF